MLTYLFTSCERHNTYAGANFSDIEPVDAIRTLQYDDVVARSRFMRRISIPLVWYIPTPPGSPKVTFLNYEISTLEI